MCRRLPCARLAIFSDVHADLPALEAVLGDIGAAAVDARCALGDLVGYAPLPNEVLERLAAEGLPIVMGNDDGTTWDRDECGCAYTNPIEQAQPFDHVITVCDRARQSCPVFPGSGNSLRWGLEDPAEVEGSEERRLEAFRRTRTELTLRLRPFIEIARRTAGVPRGGSVIKG